MTNMDSMPGEIRKTTSTIDKPIVRINAGTAAQLGALVSAVMASACCWLPLLLLVFGISGSALSAAFEAWRPVMLPITFLLLAMAFYFTYKKPQAVSPLEKDAAGGHAEPCCDTTQSEKPAGVASHCCPPESTQGFPLKKFNKIMLWIVTVFVLGFAFFPNYGGLLMGNEPSLASRNDLDILALQVDGMTCEACAVTIDKALTAVAGVAEAEVNFEKGQALVGIAKGAIAPKEEIVKAVKNAGYTAVFVEKNK